ncbi:MAG: YceI family protein [Pseudobdellovibrionaceae bacterium]
MKSSIFKFIFTTLTSLTLLSSASAKEEKKTAETAPVTQAPATVPAETPVTSSAASSKISLEGSVSFLAIGKPSFLKIKGKGDSLKGKAEVAGSQVTGEFQFPLKNLSTGINMRDEHMKDKYLQVSQFPNATLKITKLDLPVDFDVKNSELKDQKFEGTMQIHGKEKPIAGTANFNGKDSTLTAKMNLKISDYGVDIPSYMGITVSEDVEVEITSTNLTVK